MLELYKVLRRISSKCAKLRFSRAKKKKWNSRENIPEYSK